MALQTAIYLVTKEIAERSGLIDGRYRVADGRFVLNDRDLSRVRFSIDEYVNGLKGVEMITDTEAKALIKANGYALGVAENSEQALQDVATDEEQVNAPTNENTEEEVINENMEEIENE